MAMRTLKAISKLLLYQLTLAVRDGTLRDVIKKELSILDIQLEVSLDSVVDSFRKHNSNEYKKIIAQFMLTVKPIRLYKCEFIR